MECNLKTLKGRREDMCNNLIRTFLDPSNKLHDLLPPKICEIRNRETRSSDKSFVILTVKHNVLEIDK